MAATASLIATTIAVAGTAYSAVNEYNNLKSEESAAKYNAQVARNEIKSTRMEQSVATDRQREAAIKKLAAGQNAMVASGAIGGSADTILTEGYFNLDEDIAALNYNYDSKVSAKEAEVDLYEYKAEMARKNAISSLIAGGLSAAGTLAGGVSDFVNKNGSGTGAVVDAYGNRMGKVGGYGEWNPNAYGV